MPNETDIGGDVMFEHINGLTDNPPLPPVAKMLPDSKKPMPYGLVDFVDSLSPPPFPTPSAVDTEVPPSDEHCPEEKMSPVSPAKESSWRNKLKGAREATAGVLLQARQAEEVGLARVKQQRLVLKDMSHIATMRDEDARTEALQKSKHEIEEIPKGQEVVQEEFSYQALYSSCDGEPSILDENSTTGHRVRSFRSLLTAVKKVDQIRTLQSNSQHGGSSSASDSSAGAVGGTDISDEDVKPIEEKTVEDLMTENKRLTPEAAQKKLIKDLRKHVKSLNRENLSIILERDELIGKRREELESCKSKIRLAKKEVEERNLKLAVLEQHFCALNNCAPSFDSNQCLSFDTSASTDIDVVPARDGENFNEDDDISTNDGPVIRKSHLSSIVQVDKSYIVELQTSQKKLTAELEHLKCKHSILVETSSMLEGDLQREVEDLTEKLACRERTVSDLERSIKQMREARFLKKSKSHRRRSTIGAVDMTAGNQKTASGDEDSSDEMINQSVRKAIALKEKEHEEEVTKLKERLELKNKIVKRLEGKVESLKAKGNIRSPQRTAPQAAMMRNIAVTGEMMDTSIRRLESMLKQIDQSVHNQKDVDKNDDMAPIRRVASKLSLVNEELKMSVKLIEQKHTNELESILLKNKGSASANANTGEPPVITGQSSSEGDQWKSISQKSLEDAIRQAQEQATKMTQETETSIYKSLDELKDRLRDIEFDMEAKQDMIEALELACSEHVSNCRSLREQLEEKKAEIEASQTPAIVQSE